MTAAHTSVVRRLRGFGNGSWLTSRQLDKLGAALVISSIEKHSVISEDKNSTGNAFVLLSASREYRAATARGHAPC